MKEFEKLNENDEAKITGGATVRGQQVVMLEESEIKKYEYKCKSCGEVTYRPNENVFCKCPKCGKFFGYSFTGNVLMDYDCANKALWRAAQGRDT